MHDPNCHMLWNLDYLADEEKSSPELKQLLDNLRTYGLFPYYLSKQYHEAAEQELSKVNWERQPKKTSLLYKAPIGLLRIREAFLVRGSFLKQRLLKFLRFFTG